MDIRKVKKLIEMLENSNLEEIEIQEGEESVRLVKSNGSAPKLQQQSIVVPQENLAVPVPPGTEENEVASKDSNSIGSLAPGTGVTLNITLLTGLKILSIAIVPKGAFGSSFSSDGV